MIRSLAILTTCLLLTACQCGGAGGTGGGAGGSGGAGGAGGSGGGTSDGGSKDGGTGGSGGGGTAVKMLVVDPPTSTVTVTTRGVMVSQQLTAKELPSGAAVNVGWSIDRPELGAIDSTGKFSTASVFGGIVTVTAAETGGTRKALARIVVQVDLHETVGTTPVDPVQKMLLDGAGTGISPASDAGTTDGGGVTLPDGGVPPPGPTVLYPYNGTVFPRGILSPLVQYVATPANPIATRLRITAPNYSWVGDSVIADPTKPRAELPDDVWDSALKSASGTRFTLAVSAANATTASGVTVLELNAANGSLKGSVYYMTYEAADLGVWRVRTGTKVPADHVVSDCTVCHSVSANGQRLVTGGEGAAAPNAGVFTLEVDGGLTKVASAPAGLLGDSRGLSFAFLTPDGKFVLRSQKDFWGGFNTQAWRIDDQGKQLVPAEVVGMGSAVSALVPTISPDGRFAAFTTGPGDPNDAGVATRSLSIMDLAIDPSVMDAGRLTFSNRRVIVDNGNAGPVAKFVTFLPDTKQLVFQEHTGQCDQYDRMLPTWASGCGEGPISNGHLAWVNAATGARAVMDKANRGLAPSDDWLNYEPFALPVPAGGYYWVVFTSRRPYGNTYTAAEARKQLWVTAINPNAPAGDPSAPAFFLPNQRPTRNERGYWALDPCKSMGAGCSSGDDCCEGFCRAPAGGGAPVCTTKQACALETERCQVDSDCCPPFEGPALTCLGGFCAKPAVDAGEGGIN